MQILILIKQVLVNILYLLRIILKMMHKKKKLDFILITANYLFELNYTIKLIKLVF